MRVLTPRQTYAKVGLSRSTIWRLESRGLFPRAVKLVGTKRGYIEHEINAWIESKQEERDFAESLS